VGLVSRSALLFAEFSEFLAVSRFGEKNRVRVSGFVHGSAMGYERRAGSTKMTNGRTKSALGELRALFVVGTATGLNDSQLLERFCTKRAETDETARAAEQAFAALVDRHGAMVWGVCRRVLGDLHDAEDAFQATFLLLVRKAESVRVDGSLGRWLYGVAHRVALRARAEAERRESRRSGSSTLSCDDPADAAEVRDLAGVIGQEMDRLPAKYRCPVELCYLQGLTYDQAADRLNWPVATVKNRLAKGRASLRTTLARRGLAPVAAGAVAALSAKSRAAIPARVIRSTILSMSGGARIEASLAVTNLTQGVLTMMAWERLKLAAAGILVAAGLTAGALAQQGPTDQVATASGAKSEAQATEKPKPKDATDRRWVGMHPNGATIEVVGVSSHPADPTSWWRPDGSPLPQGPCDASNANITTDQGDIIRAVVVRLTGIPERTEHRWSITPAGHAASYESAKLENKPVRGLMQAVVAFPKDTTTCTVRMEVASGPWNTVQSWGKWTGAIGNADGSGFIFGRGIATKTGTAVSVTHNIEDKSVRLVAVDQEGKEHTTDKQEGAGVANFHMLVGEFAMPLEKIREFRIQTRSFERVDLPDVALNPAAKTK
jgi:RNA polymerase sigma factor (sigma-70 family)